ncbi:MAG: PDZ domain-containing protein [Flavobacterium sp.]|nr:MAG: PDZ domain-containing protein [Flavobacterium sp.]
MKSCNNQIKASFLILIVTGLTYLIGSPNYLHAQTFFFEHKVKRDAISFTKVKNLIVIPVFINNKGPYNFLLDTGVDPLIITDSLLVEELNYQNTRPIKINGLGSNAEIDALFTADTFVKINRASMAFVPTVILKNDIFNLDGYLGMKISGLIGFHFFNSFVVKVNYETNRINYSLPNFNKKIKGTKVDVEILGNKPYINTILKSEQLGEIPVKLIVDCGAGHSLSLETLNAAPFPIPKTSIVGNLGIGLAGEISGYIGRISSLKLGNYEMKNVVTNFPNFNDVAAKTNQKDRNGNIGSGILKRFNITYDYGNNAIYFKKNGFFDSKFEHDMTGIELFVTSDLTQRLIVSRIEAGSPAELAGVKINDEIISINFKKTDTYTLEEINNLFRNSDGQTVVLELYRKDGFMVKLLRLKRRI